MEYTYKPSFYDDKCLDENICIKMDDNFFNEFMCCLEDCVSGYKPLDDCQKFLWPCCNPLTHCCLGDFYPENKNCPCDPAI